LNLEALARLTVFEIGSKLPICRDFSRRAPVDSPASSALCAPDASVPRRTPCLHRRQAFPGHELGDEELARNGKERIPDTCTPDEVTAREPFHELTAELLARPGSRASSGSYAQSRRAWGAADIGLALGMLKDSRLRLPRDDM
jgi:hypothetical protein